MSNSFFIDVFSHHIVVTGFSKQGKDVLLDFCATRVGQRGLVFVGHGQYTMKLIKLFATATKNRKEFRFHINSLPELKIYLYQKLGNNCVIEESVHEVNHVVPVKLSVSKGYEPREKQIPIIDYLTTDKKYKLVTIQPGAGKTVLSLTAVQRLGMRTALIIPGKYVDKWIGDCKSILGIKVGELLVVRGSKDLKRLIELAMVGELKASIIIITSTTLFNYIKDYEQNSGTSDQYACKPQDFFKVLGVGVRLMDEVHQNFHLNFKIDLYTHVATSIDLSATMDVDDQFMSRMYLLKYPRQMRYQNGAYDKYIAVTALHYSLLPETKIRTSYYGMTQYSHTAFEESILSKKKTLSNYLKLVEQCVKNLYLKIRKPNQKLLIFAATKEMCAVMAKDIQKYTPGLKVGKYVSEDDYSSLMNNDISVSTYQSSGTAVDIDGLRVAISTTAIQSRQANEQMMGRLRRLKQYPDETPEYYYFVCTDIPKHIEYSEHKFDMFKDKVLSHKVAYLRGGL